MKCTITPQVRRTSEIPYHSDLAPGQRFVFVGKTLNPMCQIYIVGRKVEAIPANQPEWLKDHRHNCPTFYLLIGGNVDLTGLTAEVVIEGTPFVAEAPSAIMLPPGALHHHRLINGGGWSFHVNIRSDYEESLLQVPSLGIPDPSMPKIEEVYRKAEPYSGTVRNWEMQDGSFDPHCGNRSPIMWKFVDPGEFPRPGVRLHMHQITEKSQIGWRELPHRHPTDEVCILLPSGSNPLKLLVTAGAEFSIVSSPISVYQEAGILHNYRYIQGDGLLVKVLKL